MEYAKLDITEYLERLSSKAPVPGGGGTAALAGALGIALGAMVGNLTVGKKKYAAVEEEMRNLIDEADALRLDLVKLIDHDAEAFAPLSEAYGLPKETPEEIAHKEEVMEKCLKEAASVPMQIMEDGAKAVALLSEFAQKGSALAISDAGCGAAFIKAAMESAALNVWINTKYMKDRETAEKLNVRTAEILDDFGEKAETIYNHVRERLGG